MSYPDREMTEFDISFDLPFIFRMLRKWLVAIICMAIVVSVCVYIGADLTMKDTYSVTATMAIAPRQNTTSVLSDRIMSEVVTRNVSMWNGRVLMKTIEEQHPEWNITGTISAKTVSGTNLLEIQVTEKSAEEAYRLMNAAIECSEDISDSYNSDYYNVLLTHDILRTLKVSHKSAARLSAAAFLLVIIGFVGLIGAWSIFTPVIHNEYQARRLLNVPLYGALPEVKLSENENALVLTDPELPITYLEALERLTARVESQMRFNKNKILMVTSIQENEGKTTVSINLARRLAQRGKKTLLVELDLRNPSIGQSFFKEKQQRNYIANVEKGSPISDLIQHHDSLKMLDLLLQYTHLDDADRILESLDLGQKLRDLADSYDCVILDTPPIAPVRDAEVIAEMADCALLVIQQDCISASVVNDACEMLEEHELLCCGVVLNHVHNSKGFQYEKKYYDANRHRR